MVEVIFLENVENHKVGDVRNVPDGYARNYLVPKNLAVFATDEEVKKMEAKIEKLKAEEEKKVAKLETEAHKLEGLTLEFKEEASPEGKLFGSVGPNEIGEKLEKKGFKIEKHQIEVPEHIKTIGEYKAVIKYGHGVDIEISLVVKPTK